MLGMLSGDVKCGQWTDVWTHELTDSHQKQAMARVLFSLLTQHVQLLSNKIAMLYVIYI